MLSLVHNMMLALWASWASQEKKFFLIKMLFVLSKSRHWLVERWKCDAGSESVLFQHHPNACDTTLVLMSNCEPGFGLSSEYFVYVLSSLLLFLFCFYLFVQIHLLSHAHVRRVEIALQKSLKRWVLITWKYIVTSFIACISSSSCPCDIH